MKARRLKVAIMSEQEQVQEVVQVIEGIEQGRRQKPSHKLVFRSVEDLRSFLTSERLRLLRLIRSRQPSSIYELAKLAGRDRKAVMADLEILKVLGLVRFRSEGGEGRRRTVPEVPYAGIDISVEV